MSGRYVFNAISPDTFNVVEFNIRVPSGLNKIQEFHQAPAPIAERKSDGLKASFRNIFVPWRVAAFIKSHSLFSEIMFGILGLALVIVILVLFGLPFFAFFRIAESGNGEFTKNVNLCHQAISSQLYESAIKHCDAALKVAPNDGNALDSKGVALYGLGKYEEAAEYFIKALGAMPEDSVVLTNQCDALYQLGKHQAAIGYCDKALSIDPSNARAQALKNASLAALNLVSPSGGSALTFNKEKFMLACLGNKMTREECIKAFCRYLIDPSLEPECSKPASLTEKTTSPKTAIDYFGRGMDYYDARSYREAIINFSTCIDLEPTNVNCYEMRSIVYGELGDKRKENKDFKAAEKMRKMNALEAIKQYK